MDKSKNNRPSWLNDSKKMLIIFLVIVCAIGSTVNTFALSFFSGAFTSSTSGIVRSIVQSVSHVGGIHPGYYVDDYGYEAFYFDGKGNVTYYYGQYVANGTYGVTNDNYLEIVLDNQYYNSFHIAEKNKNILAIESGTNLFVYHRNDTIE